MVIRIGVPLEASISITLISESHEDFTLLVIVLLGGAIYIFLMWAVFIYDHKLCWVYNHKNVIKIPI